jgi:hypothetical protein
MPAFSFWSVHLNMPQHTGSELFYIKFKIVGTWYDFVLGSGFFA